MYKLKCGDCPGYYVSQTGRTFQDRCKEHTRSIKYSKDSTAFTPHILNTKNSYGLIDKTLEIIKTFKKGKFMDTT
jgi:hypothetical protein